MENAAVRGAADTLATQLESIEERIQSMPASSRFVLLVPAHQLFNSTVYDFMLKFVYHKRDKKSDHPDKKPDGADKKGTVRMQRNDVLHEMLLHAKFMKKFVPYCIHPAYTELKSMVQARSAFFFKHHQKVFDNVPVGIFLRTCVQGARIHAPIRDRLMQGGAEPKIAMPHICDVKFGNPVYEVDRNKDEIHRENRLGMPLVGKIHPDQAIENQTHNAHHHHFENPQHHSFGPCDHAPLNFCEDGLYPAPLAQYSPYMYESQRNEYASALGHFAHDSYGAHANVAKHDITRNIPPIVQPIMQSILNLVRTAISHLTHYVQMCTHPFIFQHLCRDMLPVPSQIQGNLSIRDILHEIVFIVEHSLCGRFQWDLVPHVFYTNRILQLSVLCETDVQLLFFILCSMETRISQRFPITPQ